MTGFGLKQSKFGTKYVNAMDYEKDEAIRCEATLTRVKGSLVAGARDWDPEASSNGLP